MDIRHKKEVDYEVDQPNAEQNVGGKGKNSPLKNNKNTWIAIAVLMAILITLILVVSNV